MIARSRFGLATLLLWAMAAGPAAASTADPGTSPAHALAVKPVSAPAVAPPAGLVTIFSNIGGKYPNSLFFCCDGFSVQGKDNVYSDRMLWRAEAFTPGANHVVKRIELGLGVNNGSNTVVIGLYNDVAGVPGSALKTWHVQNVPQEFTCCTLVSVRSKAGIAVTGGQQYWVVVKTDDSDSDGVFGWLYNTTDQLETVPSAVYCSDDVHGSCGVNDAWVSNGAIVPALAFGVFGN